MTRMRRPSSASVDGDLVMTDGPFVEAKEHIAGFYIINADDLDAALAWARQGRGGDQPSDRGSPLPSDRARPGMTGGVAADVEAVAVERVFREAYGQAVATLVRIFGDITLAEDAVQDAFVVASRSVAKRRHPTQPGRVDHYDRTESCDR